MLENIEKQFSKHYKRIEEDISQLQDIPPVVMKIISFNLTKLKNDIKNEAQNGMDTNTDR